MRAGVHVGGLPTGRALGKVSVLRVRRALVLALSHAARLKARRWSVAAASARARGP